MPFEIQQSRWDKLLRRVSGSIGPGSRVGTSISDLFPVLDVERVPGELLLLMGTRICHGAARVTGAAGELPNAILFNPVDSGQLITITQISVAVDVNNTIRCEVSEGVSGAQVISERFREGRLITPTTLPVGQIRDLSNSSQLAQQVDFAVLANDSKFFSDPNGLAVLAPNTKYVVASTSVALTITVTFWWRERVAEQSELNL